MSLAGSVAKVPKTFEVAVLGAGPAGATVALRLAQLGHNVVLVEGRPSRSGLRMETLSPGTLRLVQGCYPEWWPKLARCMATGIGSILWTRRDLEAGASSRPVTLVDRGQFDPVLCEAAGVAGAIRSFSSSGFRPIWHAGKGCGELHDASSGNLVCRSLFMVDAAGRYSPFPAARRRLGACTVALSACGVCDASQGAGTHVEALGEGWLWSAWAENGKLTVSAFVSPGSVRSSPSRRPEGLLRQVLGTSPWATAKGVRLASGVSACTVTASERVPAIDERMLRVGDAAFSMDPLSSQGLQHALITAGQAAVVIHTLLTCESNSELAFDFYKQRQAESVLRHQAVCAHFYRQQNRFDGAFWRERRAAADAPLEKPVHTEATRRLFAQALQARIVLSKNARWHDTPVICGDLVKCRAALYHPSLDRPVAYLEDRLASDLLAHVGLNTTGLALMEAWVACEHMDLTSAQRALTFLLTAGLIERTP